MQAPSNSPFRTDVTPFVRQAWSVRDQADAAEAARMLQRAPSNVLYVTKDDTMQLIGVITGCDLIRLSEGKATARELATTRDIIGIKSDTSIANAIRIMYGENSIKKLFRVLPVLNDAKELLGVVHRDELESALESPRRSSSSLSY